MGTDPELIGHAASDALRRENERLRRDLARALKGQAVPGSGELVQPRRMDSVVTLRMDSDTLQALVELTEAHRTTRGEVIREAVRRMSNGHRMGPNTQGAWGVLILPKRAKRSEMQAGAQANTDAHTGESSRTPHEPPQPAAATTTSEAHV